MMEKLFKILKKYKLAFITGIIVIILGFSFIMLFNLLLNKQKMEIYNSKNYTLNYDSTWKIKEKDDNKIKLKHKSSDSSVEIEIISLESESKYSSIDDLMDEILYNAENQNKEYKLISRKETQFTSKKYNGYKLLFEIEKNQAMVATYKKGDKLLLATYEASNEYFDILLDSVQNIIDKFDIKEQQFNLKNSMKLETNDISYADEKTLDEKISKNKKYEIANKNYSVIYSVPDNFILSSYDSQYNYFNYKVDKDKEITLNVSILNRNIFEYLDKENTLNVYSNHKYERENKDYLEYKEYISKLENNEKAYIYKNEYFDKAYNYDKDFNKIEYKRKNENYELIYSLNNNHILVFKITSKNISITKKLIEQIKVESSKNYSSYIKNKNENNKIISELKRYTDYDRKKIDSIVISIPDKYKEFDKNSNIYEYRYYGLNYDEEKEIYDYEVEYHMTSNTTKDLNKQVDIINGSFSKSYGEYNYLSLTGDREINNKKFTIYDGGYTTLGGVMFTNVNRFKYYINKKVLGYSIDSGGYLLITVSGNGKTITDEILNDITNFVIEQKSV